MSAVPLRGWRERPSTWSQALQHKWINSGTRQSKEENPICPSHHCSSSLWWFECKGRQTVRLWTQTKSLHPWLSVTPSAYRGPSLCPPPVTWSISNLRLEKESWPSVVEDNRVKGSQLNAYMHTIKWQTVTILWAQQIPALIRFGVETKRSNEVYL